MKFDLMGIIFMIIAIALGQLLGSFLEGYIGSLGSGLLSTFIVGFLAYVIYTFLTKAKFGVTNALIFTVLIYVSNLIAGYVGGFIGLSGGIVTIVVTALFASLLWGWIGGRSRRALKL
jgi:hypothetical protein